MTGVIEWFRGARWAIVLTVTVALTAFAVRQTLALADTRTSLAQLQAQQANQQSADTTANAAGLALNARLTQENTHAFTTSWLGLVQQAQINAAARAADADRIASLQHDIQSAATGAAYAAADAAACRNLADQHQQLWTLVSRGVGIVGQLQSVAGRGQELVAERDAQVTGLKGQIDADRTVLDPAAAE